MKKDIGVVLFTNTSMPDEETGGYFDIFDALWAQAERMRSGRMVTGIKGH